MPACEQGKMYVCLFVSEYVHMLEGGTAFHTVLSPLRKLEKANVHICKYDCNLCNFSFSTVAAKFM